MMRHASLVHCLALSAAQLIGAATVLAGAPQPGLSQQLPGGLHLDRAIGVSDGPGHVFGWIIDVAIAESGEIAVADNFSDSVHVFDASGRYRFGFGGHGRGPGEHRGLRRVEIDSTRVITFDALNRRVSLFPLIGDGVGDVRTMPVPPEMSVVDFCMLDDRMFVAGFYREKLLHELSWDGDVLRSFGSPFLDHPALKMRAPSELRCVEDPRPLVVLVSMNQAIVRAYDPGGTLRWEGFIPDFRQVVMTPSEGGWVRYTEPESGGPAHLVTAVVPWQDQLLVQFGEEFPGMRSTEEISDVETAVFPLRGGEPRVTRSFPRVDAFYNGRFYAHGSLPFPRVLTYQVEQ